MASMLVVYGTTEGQTEAVATRLVDALSERGHDAAAVRAGSVDAAVDEYDAVVVGSSIHYGKQHSDVVEFVEANREALSARPTAFFQVSLSSAVDDEARRANAARYVDEFVEASDWNPERIGLFGGALRYSKYGFLKRLMLKRIAKDATGDTDTDRDYEYTDWAEVDAFAADFAGFVERRLGATSPQSDESTEHD